MLFGSGERRVIAMTYGPTTDWARNVLAAGHVAVMQRGRAVHLVEPRLVHDPAGRLVPRPIRWVLRVIGAADFLELRVRR